jgi:hypothetical protein
MTPSAAHGRNQSLDTLSRAYDCESCGFARHERSMQEFAPKYGDKIQGVLSGFDRLIF